MSNRNRLTAGPVRRLNPRPARLVEGDGDRRVADDPVFSSTASAWSASAITNRASAAGAARVTANRAANRPWRGCPIGQPGWPPPGAPSAARTDLARRPCAHSFGLMGAEATLRPGRLPVAPGGEAVAEISVKNTGLVVDSFALSVLGDGRGLGVLRAGAHLPVPGPGRHRAGRYPPRRCDSGLPHGPLPFAVRVASSEDPPGSVVEEGVLDISPMSLVTTDMSPRTGRCPRHGRRAGTGSPWTTGATRPRHRRSGRRRRRRHGARAGDSRPSWRCRRARRRVRPGPGARPAQVLARHARDAPVPRDRASAGRRPGDQRGNRGAGGRAAQLAAPGGGVRPGRRSSPLPRCGSACCGRRSGTPRPAREPPPRSRLVNAALQQSANPAQAGSAGSASAAGAASAKPSDKSASKVPAKPKATPSQRHPLRRGHRPRRERAPGPSHRPRPRRRRRRIRHQHVRLRDCRQAGGRAIRD